MNIRLELLAVAYRPGDELAGVFDLPEPIPSGTRSVELSVLWQGKGTPQPSVVHYERWRAGNDSLARLVTPYAFSLTLPTMPWSYEGKLVTIAWRVRVRVRYDSPEGRIDEVLREVPFVMSPTDEPIRPILQPLLSQRAASRA